MSSGPYGTMLNFITYFQESKSDIAKEPGSSKSSKHKKHKKEKKKKKHKEKDKDRDKSKKHKHKDKDKDKYEKDKHKKSKTKSEKFLEELFPKEMGRFYEKHRKETYRFEKERRSKERDRDREKHSKSKERERDVEKHLKFKVEGKSDNVKADLPLVERRVKHKIHLDGDDFIESQVSLSGKESTDDEKVKRKHKHKDKRKEDSPDRGKEKTTKVKEKEAKVKLEHLDDDEETVGFTEKEEKSANETSEANTIASKTDDIAAESAIDDKDDFKLPQRKVDDDHVSSVFERNISLKMPSIKPLEKYKELKKKDKLAASELGTKSDKKEDIVPSASNKSDDGKLQKNESSDKPDKDIAAQQGSSKDITGKDGRKKGLPDMRLISVLPKRKVEIDDSKTVGEIKTPEDKTKTPDEDEEGRKVTLMLFSLCIAPLIHHMRIIPLCTK